MMRSSRRFVFSLVCVLVVVAGSTTSAQAKNFLWDQDGPSGFTIQQAQGYTYNVHPQGQATVLATLTNVICTTTAVVTRKSCQAPVPTTLPQGVLVDLTAIDPPLESGHSNATSTPTPPPNPSNFRIGLLHLLRPVALASRRVLLGH